jgi:hypothetical protein
VAQLLDLDVNIDARADTPRGFPDAAKKGLTALMVAAGNASGSGRLSASC